ncbi:MAG TPA: DUF1648 domain-containing protein [Thermoanaerobaculia bacterium]|nr:DUF1648 domain-containing protein [Thermoanaerobaculia bacterium]HUM30912.1 DUF1648 domain-containing protein [Thermoanaerobaculia bacterium]HXK69245.1 DUF1648 domain-containing protein [Thermoanaerobaculia bacterium]
MDSQPVVREDKPAYARGILILELIILGILSIYYYDKMPERMATHFDAAGNPNGWSSRPSFFILFWSMNAFMMLIFLLLPKLLKKMPVSLINLPNKDYWFTPERKDRAFNMMEEYMAWLGVGVMGLFIAIFQMTFQANLTPDHKLGSGTWLLLGLFMTYMTFWVVLFIRAFMRKI